MNDIQFKAFQDEIHQVMIKHQVYEGILLVDDRKDKMLWMASVIVKENQDFLRIAKGFVLAISNLPKFTLYEKVVMNKGKL